MTIVKEDMGAILRDGAITHEEVRERLTHPEKTSVGRPRSWTRDEDIALAWAVYRNQTSVDLERSLNRSKGASNRKYILSRKYGEDWHIAILKEERLIDNKGWLDTDEISEIIKQRSQGLSLKKISKNIGRGIEATRQAIMKHAPKQNDLRPHRDKERVAAGFDPLPVGYPIIMRGLWHGLEHWRSAAR